MTSFTLPSVPLHACASERQFCAVMRSCCSLVGRTHRRVGRPMEPLFVGGVYAATFQEVAEGSHRQSCARKSLSAPLPQAGKFLSHFACEKLAIETFDESALLLHITRCML